MCGSVVVTLLILPEALGSVMKGGKGRRNSKAAHPGCSIENTIAGL